MEISYKEKEVIVKEIEAFKASSNSKRDIKKLKDLPGVNFIMLDIVANRVVRDFPKDKYNEEFQKIQLSDVEELFKRMPEAEEKAFEIVTERVLKEIRK